MKIAVIGPGAMGMLFGGYLSKENDVTMVGTRPAAMEQMKQEGITITETDGSSAIYTPNACADTSGLGYMDLIILFVKASASKSALDKNRHLISPDTILMTLQNGAGHENLLLQYVDADHVIIGTTQQGSTKTSDNSIFHSGLGSSAFGAVNGHSERFNQIAEVFTACGFPSEVTDNVKYMIWNKLMINASSSVLSGVLQVPQGYVEQDSYAWSIACSLITELCETATADGYPFDAKEQIARLQKHLQAAPDGLTSIYADLKSGRRTEADFITGAVVDAARKHGILAPTHELMLKLVHAMEGRKQ